MANSAKRNYESRESGKPRIEISRIRQTQNRNLANPALPDESGTLAPMVKKGSPFKCIFLVFSKIDVELINGARKLLRVDSFPV